MAGGGQSIQRVVAKRLGASPVRQLSAIPHPVVQIIRLVEEGFSYSSRFTRIRQAITLSDDRLCPRGVLSSALQSKACQCCCALGDTLPPTTFSVILNEDCIEPFQAGYSGLINCTEIDSHSGDKKMITEA